MAFNVQAPGRVVFGIAANQVRRGFDDGERISDRESCFSRCGRDDLGPHAIGQGPRWDGEVEHEDRHLEVEEASQGMGESMPCRTRRMLGRRRHLRQSIAHPRDQDRRCQRRCVRPPMAPALEAHVEPGAVVRTAQDLTEPRVEVQSRSSAVVRKGQLTGENVRLAQHLR